MLGIFLVKHFLSQWQECEDSKVDGWSGSTTRVVMQMYRTHRFWSRSESKLRFWAKFALFMELMLAGFLTSLAHTHCSWITTGFVALMGLGCLVFDYYQISEYLEDRTYNAVYNAVSGAAEFWERKVDDGLAYLDKHLSEARYLHAVRSAANPPQGVDPTQPDIQVESLVSVPVIDRDFFGFVNSGITAVLAAIACCTARRPMDIINSMRAVGEGSREFFRLGFDISHRRALMRDMAAARARSAFQFCRDHSVAAASVTVLSCIGIFTLYGGVKSLRKSIGKFLEERRASPTCTQVHPPETPDGSLQSPTVKVTAYVPKPKQVNSDALRSAKGAIVEAKKSTAGNKWWLYDDEDYLIFDNVADGERYSVNYKDIAFFIHDMGIDDAAFMNEFGYGDEGDTVLPRGRRAARRGRATGDLEANPAEPVKFVPGGSAKKGTGTKSVAVKVVDDTVPLPKSPKHSSGTFETECLMGKRPLNIEPLTKALGRVIGDGVGGGQMTAFAQGGWVIFQKHVLGEPGTGTLVFGESKQTFVAGDVQECPHNPELVRVKKTLTGVKSCHMPLAIARPTTNGLLVGLDNNAAPVTNGASISAPETIKLGDIDTIIVRHSAPTLAGFCGALLVDASDERHNIVGFHHMALDKGKSNAAIAFNNDIIAWFRSGPKN